MAQTRVPAGRRWRRALPAPLAPLALLGAAAAATAYVASVDPSEAGHYPTCPFLWATGLYCPGCGSLRMIHALVHGEVGEAFGRNPLAFLLLPVLGYLWIRWLAAAVGGRPVTTGLMRPAAAWALGVLLIAYWIVRNLPVGHALAP
ncbi:DUF2752 domain-containing protein [Actinomadura sp. HBU206391]|uniref:DUF2752 domain-containing protein n=1 Tax=Actinomadura sp. HBU206391 TaxID=2731692 RepID=UPI00164F958F|nr:DUF2752 domain-containing protein [Actinomadura sp. HBU206391]MBC6462361.1 DUF2752 domain-containing protein [Actinomadura sp. HBU206391]